MADAAMDGVRCGQFSIGEKRFDCSKPNYYPDFILTK